MGRGYGDKGGAGTGVMRAGNGGRQAGEEGAGTGEEGAGVGRFLGRGLYQICCILLILSIFMNFCALFGYKKCLIDVLKLIQVYLQ